MTAESLTAALTTDPRSADPRSADPPAADRPAATDAAGSPEAAGPSTVAVAPPGDDAPTVGTAAALGAVGSVPAAPSSTVGHPDVVTAGHDSGHPDALVAFMATGWGDPAPVVERADVAAFTPARRRALAARFPGEVLVLGAGAPLVRANDTDYPFRASSDYTWLTGATAPLGVLLVSTVLADPQAPDRDPGLLLVPARQPRGSRPFFADRVAGELWVGPQPGVTETAEVLGVRTRPRSDLRAALTDALSAARADPDGAAPSASPEDLATAVLPVRWLAGTDAALDAEVRTVLAELTHDAGPGPSDQRQAAADAAADGGAARAAELATVLSELRLVKDAYELAELQAAVDATIDGFADAVRELPAAAALAGRGERWLEGTFTRRARWAGADVGYGSIVAAGPHATTLHWTRNDGPVRPGELLLADMGVERDSLYTADVTRTLPINGRFSDAQRTVYTAVWRAQQAALATIRPGAHFLDPNRAAMRVLATALHAWGVLPTDVESSLDEDPAAPHAGLHRRWTLHNVSHMLGLDVHDCAAARAAYYRDGTLEAGMVLTVEPGLYFQLDDELAPPQFRGIGVRIEDDVVVTATGVRVLSAALPSEPAAVEAWVSGLLPRP